ncbi:MAG: VOC family protein [Chromatiales bacterium]|nr:VOC family protein [Chromatiales bacterium]
MSNVHLHHIHIFASDIDASVAWYVDNLGGVVAYDGDFGGARNVFMHIGTGRLNIYAQPPRGDTTGAYHHIGMQTDNLVEIHDRLLTRGISFRSGIREFENWRYIMCPAPDGVLLELFEIDVIKMPPALSKFFSPQKP